MTHDIKGCLVEAVEEAENNLAELPECIRMSILNYAATQERDGDD